MARPPRNPSRGPARRDPGAEGRGRPRRGDRANPDGADRGDARLRRDAALRGRPPGRGRAEAVRGPDGPLGPGPGPDGHPRRDRVPGGRRGARPVGGRPRVAGRPADGRAEPGRRDVQGEPGTSPRPPRQHPGPCLAEGRRRALPRRQPPLRRGVRPQRPQGPAGEERLRHLAPRPRLGLPGGRPGGDGAAGRQTGRGADRRRPGEVVLDGDGQDPDRQRRRKGGRHVRHLARRDGPARGSPPPRAVARRAGADRRSGPPRSRRRTSACATRWARGGRRRMRCG